MKRKLFLLLIPAGLLLLETAAAQFEMKKVEDGTVMRGNRRTLEEIDGIYAGMLPVKYEPPAGRLSRLPRTRRILREGGTWTVVMLGDSIINDTSRSAWDLLVARRHPDVRIEKITSVRGSTGCWWYKEPGRVKAFVLDHDPDVVIIGGISQKDDVDSIREVIRQIREASQADVVLMTGPFGRVDPKDDAGWREIVNPKKESYAARLRALAAETKAEFIDLQQAWGRYVRGSGQPVGLFKRDVVHANERGEQILGRILERYFE